MISFFSNTTILRYCVPDIFAVVTLWWELGLSMILFLGKEGSRGALLRFPISNTAEVDLKPRGKLKPEGKVNETSHVGVDNEQLQKLITLAYLPFPYVLLLYILFILYSYMVDSLPSFSVTSPLLLLTSLLLQFISEPYYLLFQTTGNFQVRLFVESCCTFQRNLLLVILIVCKNSGEKLTVEECFWMFAITQILADLLALFIYHVHKIRSFPGLKMLPTFASVRRCYSYFGNQAVLAKEEKKVLDVAKTLTISNVAQQFLNQGDLLLLSMMHDSPLKGPLDSSQTVLASKGLFSIANNYASILPRILFQPIEESIFIHYSTCETPGNLDLLRSWFKGEIYVCLFAITFGPFLTLPVAQLLLGNSSENIEDIRILSRIFQVWCFYLPLLAINGILDAYLTAKSDASALSQYQKRLIYCTLAFFVLVAYPLTIFREFFFSHTPFAIPGTVLFMNILNATLRITLQITRNREMKLNLSFPSPWIVFLFGLTFILQAFYEPSQLGSGLVLQIGKICLLVALLCTAIIILDSPFLKSFIALLCK